MKKEPIKVLLIEDDLGYARLITEMINDAKGQSFVVEHQRNLNTGLKRLSRGGVDVILLDLLLPDSNGLDTFLTVRNRANEIPIVVLTGIENKKTAHTAVRRGAQDYLFKREITPGLLARALSYAVLRKKTEEELVESKLKLRAQYMGIPIPTYTWQKMKEGFVLLNYNNAALTVTDGNISGYLGMVANEIFDDGKEILSDLYSCYRKKTYVKREIVDRNKFFSDGRHLAISYTYVPPDLVLIHTEDITEYSQDKKALSRTIKFFKSTFLASIDGVVVTDISQNIIMVNEAFCNLFGKKMQEVNETSLFEWLEQFEGDAKKRWAELEKKVRKAGVSRDVEFAKVSGDKKIHLSVNASVVKQIIDEEAGVVVSIWRDTTEKKLAEEELIKSKEELNFFFENIDDIPYRADDKGNVVFTNKNAEKVTGLPLDEIIGKPFLRLFTEESQKVAKEEYMKTLQGDIVEYELTFKNGKVCYFKNKPLQDKSGKVVGTFGIARDITDRKHTEEALRKSQQEYQSLFENSPISLWVEDFSEVKKYIDTLRNSGVKDFREYFKNNKKDVEKCASLVRVVDINKATLKMYNAENKENFFKGLGLFFDEETYDAFKEEIIKIAEGKTAYEGEAVNRTLTGEKIHISFKWTVAPGSEETYSKVFVSITDITEQKRIEEALASTAEEWQETFDAVDDMIAIIDSERNILRVNRAMKETFGDKEIEEKKCYELFHGSNEPLLLCPCTKSFETGELEQLEIKEPHLDNRIFDVFTYPISVEEGNTKKVVHVVRDITERVRAEEALKESEEKFRTLADFTFDWEYWKGVDGKFIYTSPSVERITGYLPKDLFDDPNIVKKIAHPDDRHLLEEHKNEIEENYHKAYYLNFRIVTKDGETKWIGHVCQPVYDTDGNLLGRRGSNRDITDQRLAEEAHKFQSAITEQVTNSIIVTDTEFKIVYVNQATIDIYQYSEDEFLGKTPDFMNAEPMADQIQKDIYGTVAAGEVWVGDVKNRRKDGSTFDSEVRITPIFDGDGKIIAYASVISDITFRKKWEEMIIGVAQEWRAMFDSFSDKISIMDKDHRYIKVNMAFADTFNLHPRDIVGKVCYEFVHGLKQPLPNCPHLEAIKTKGLVVREDFDPENGIHTEATISPVFNDDGEVVATVNFTKDITERKIADEKIKQSLSEKEILIREVHHRVKNNLQVISSLLDMDSMRMGEKESYNLINDARSRVHTMALIHSQLYQSERFDKINLAKHSKDLIEYISVVHSSRETEVDHAIEDFDVTLPVNQAIPLGLVLNELITNIYKHAFKKRQKGILKCEISKSSQGVITVVVKDDGVGLPDDFDFEKVQSLGLRLVRNLVREQLKGEVTISHVKGTEFVIKFKAIMEDDEDVQNTGS